MEYKQRHPDPRSRRPATGASMSNVQTPPWYALDPILHLFVIYIRQPWIAPFSLIVVLVMARVSSSSVKGLLYAEPLARPLMFPFVIVLVSCNGSVKASTSIGGLRFSSRVCCFESPTVLSQPHSIANKDHGTPYHSLHHRLLLLTPATWDRYGWAVCSCCRIQVNSRNCLAGWVTSTPWDCIGFVRCPVGQTLRRN